MDMIVVVTAEAGMSLPAGCATSLFISFVDRNGARVALSVRLLDSCSSRPHLAD